MSALSATVKGVLALVIIVMLVHLTYVGYIRPAAEERLEVAQESGESAPRTITVIIKDYEQEICFILMFWGFFLIIQGLRDVLKNSHLFDVDLIVSSTSGKSDDNNNDDNNDSNKDNAVPPERASIDVAATIERLDNEIPAYCRDTPLILTLRMALLRYQTTANVQNLSDAVASSMEALAIQHDTANTMIRYLIWAIPSIGFIGTVRGIGQALSQADDALAGDIAGMTDSLGVAFNSTLVALLISIFLMFLYHQLQRLQDNEIIDTRNYCDKYLLGRIRRPASEAVLTKKLEVG